MNRLLIAALAAICASPAYAQVRIGVYGPLTGGSQQMGTSMRNGVELAADEINARGGVLGQKIELVVRDDEATPEKGARIVRDFLDKDGVKAILGPCNTAVANASVGYANQKHVPVIINVSTGAKVNQLFETSPENYVFRMAASDAVQAELVIKEAYDMRGHHKVALLNDDTGYGKSGLTHLQEALRRRRAEPVYVGEYKLKDTDMGPQLRAARDAGADVVISFGIGPELAALATSTRRIGWKVDLLGGWLLGMQVFAQTAGESGEGATMPATFLEASARTSIQRGFVQAYQRKYSERPLVLAPAAAQGYDSMHVLARAIAQAGSTDGRAIKLALEDLKTVYDGVTNKYRHPYSATNHEAMDVAHVLLGRVKAGRVVPIWDY